MRERGRFGGAVLASTLTTIAVFVPVVFVQEEAGQLFRDIAIAISCAVGLSLIVSMDGDSQPLRQDSARLATESRGEQLDEPAGAGFPGPLG